MIPAICDGSSTIPANQGTFISNIQQSLNNVKEFLWEKCVPLRPAFSCESLQLQRYCCCCCCNDSDNNHRTKMVFKNNKINDQNEKNVTLAIPTTTTTTTTATINNGINVHNNDRVVQMTMMTLNNERTLKLNNNNNYYNANCNELNGSENVSTLSMTPSPPQPNAFQIKQSQHTEDEYKTATPDDNLNEAATTQSLKSADVYSQKSTASIQSLINPPETQTIPNTPIDMSPPDTTETQILEEVMPITPTTPNAMADETQSSYSRAITQEQKINEDLQILDVVDDANNASNEYGVTNLPRNASQNSLNSRTESIRTQLEETTNLSRTQSIKSIAIDEDIVTNLGNQKHLHSDTLQQIDNLNLLNQNESSNKISKKHIEVLDMISNGDNWSVKGETQPRPQLLSRFSQSLGIGDNNEHPSDDHTINGMNLYDYELQSQRNSIIKSMESLYERQPINEYMADVVSTESSSHSDTLLTHIPIKPQHTPLKQKSKTSHCLKKRVSPVKQSMKSVQAELYPDTLEHFAKPREALMKAFDQFDSSNWEVIINGLKSVVRMIRYHPEVLDNHMHMTCLQLTSAVRNLRSQVSRAGCQASVEFFAMKSKYMEQECDDLAVALLHRTADTNRFLRADSSKALESMCDNLTPPKIITLLATKGATHHHSLVRTTTAKLFNRLIERLGYERIYTMPRDCRDKFFVIGANLLLEGSQETRNYAKSIFRHLSEHSSYQRLVIELIPTRIYRNIEKVLRSIQK